MRLTVRAFKPEVRDLLQQRITKIAQAQAVVFGCQAEVDYERRYPMLYNHPQPTIFYEDVIRHWSGEAALVQREPITASEDFSFFLEKVPGCYVFIGNGGGTEGGCMVHNPGYDFNDACLSTGASYWVKLAEVYLKAA